MTSKHPSKKLSLKFIFLGLIFSNNSYSNWTCKQASSIAEGNDFYSCGIGESQNEQTARDIAREASLREFQEICRRSANCRGYDYIITPQRTDCEKKSSKYKCYRGLSIRIINEKASYFSDNLNELEKEIQKKEDELEKLQNLNDAKRKLKKLNEQIKFEENNEFLESQNLNNQVESERLKLNLLKSRQEYLIEQKRWGLQFNYFYIPELPDHSKHSNAAILSLQYKIYKMFELRVSYGQIYEDKDDLNHPSTALGAANTTETLYGPHESQLFAISLPIYVYQGYYLRLEQGKINGEVEVIENKFNNIGTTTGSGYIKNYKESYDYQYRYIGIGASIRGSNGGLHLEIGQFNFDESKPQTTSISIGYEYRF